ncbi:LysE family translocator [Entomohabitans teleogrylli]|uniref:LysE family translocator n=1 Tax=Entomohabitans teleogrylli TaxID=1384589 RepID=UPI00073D7429|nr:LysE family transporter [Entomohabitans teleogrylli]
MTEWLAIITISTLAIISPGPDFAMVTRNSLILSRRAGLLTALGIGLGVVVHVTYTLVGVGLLIRNSLWLFNVIKFAGALYLIWLGIKMLRSRAGELTSQYRLAPLSDFSALRRGFFTNVLNPKTTIFIVSLFMQVVDPRTPLVSQVAYGTFISVAHIAWFSLVAYLFSSGIFRESLLNLRHWIDRLFGAFLVGFGLVLAIR